MVDAMAPFEAAENRNRPGALNGAMFVV